MKPIQIKIKYSLKIVYLPDWHCEQSTSSALVFAIDLSCQLHAEATLKCSHCDYTRISTLHDTFLYCDLIALRMYAYIRRSS